MKLVVAPLKDRDAVRVGVCNWSVASRSGNADAGSLMQELIGNAGSVAASACSLVLLEAVLQVCCECCWLPRRCFAVSEKGCCEEIRSDPQKTFWNSSWRAVLYFRILALKRDVERGGAAVIGLFPTSSAGWSQDISCCKDFGWRAMTIFIVRFREWEAGHEPRWTYAGHRPLCAMWARWDDC